MRHAEALAEWEGCSAQAREKIEEEEERLRNVEKATLGMVAHRAPTKVHGVSALQ